MVTAICNACGLCAVKGEHGFCEKSKTQEHEFPLTASDIMAAAQVRFADSQRVVVDVGLYGTDDKPLYGCSPALSALIDINECIKALKRNTERQMQPTRKSINIDRVHNGWIVAPHAEDRFNPVRQETDVATTPAQLAALVLDWAKKQDAEAKRLAKPARSK